MITEMAIHYTETNRFEIVPRYQGLSPVGFDVVDKSIGEVFAHVKMLYEAEEIILSSTKQFGIKAITGSAAEVKPY